MSGHWDDMIEAVELREDERREDQGAIDFDARYSVAGWGGVAFYLLGYVRTHRWEDGERVIDWLGDLPDAWDVDESMVRAVMVGDDREHEVDVDDLTKLDDLDYCASCGQIGCGHDGRDRE